MKAIEVYETPLAEIIKLTDNMDLHQLHDYYDHTDHNQVYSTYFQ